MTISTSSSLISIFDLNTEFGTNSNLATCGPISLSQFYRGSRYVPIRLATGKGVDGFAFSSIPSISTGTISINSFSEAHRAIWNSTYGSVFSTSGYIDSGATNPTPYGGVCAITTSSRVVTAGQFNQYYAHMGKWTRDGNLEWSMRYFTPNVYQSERFVAVDSTRYTGGGTIAAGSSPQHYGGRMLVKVNDNGVMQWQKIIRADEDMSAFGPALKVNAFDNTIITCSTYSTGFNNWYIGKFDSNGNPSWSRRLSSSAGGADPTSGLSTRGYDGNIYAGGNFIPGVGEHQVGALVKYNTSGVLQWQKRFEPANYGDPFGTPDDIYINGIAESSNGDIYCVGSAGRTDFLAELYALVLFKFNSTGSLIWQRKLGGSVNNYAKGSDIVIDNDDNIYISGTKIDQTWPMRVVIYAKYNTSGVLQWQRYFGGFSPPYATSYYLGGETVTQPSKNSLAVDGDGNLYLNYATGFLNQRAGLTKLYTGSEAHVWITAGGFGFLQTNGFIYGSLTLPEAAGDITVGNSGLTDVGVTSTSSATTTFSWLSNEVSIQTQPVIFPYIMPAVAVPQISAPKAEILETQFYLPAAAYDTNQISHLGTSFTLNPVSPTSSQIFAVGSVYGLVAGEGGQSSLTTAMYNNAGVLYEQLSTTIPAPNSLIGRAIAVSTTTSNLYLAADGDYIGSIGSAKGVLLAKRPTSAGSTETWQQKIDGPNTSAYNYAHGIALDNSDNLYVQIENINVSTLIRSMNLVKLNSSGVLQWQRRLTRNEPDTPKEGGVTVDAAGNAYVFSQFAYPPYPATATNFGVSLVKYNSSGVVQWSRQLLSTADCFARPPHFDHVSGCIYVLFKCLDANVNGKVLAKYDTSGVLQWQRRMIDPGGSACGVKTDLAGNVYVLNLTQGNTGSNTKLVLTKYSAAGVRQWGLLIERLYLSLYTGSIVIDYTGMIWVTGNTSFIAKIDPINPIETTYRSPSNRYEMFYFAPEETASTLITSNGYIYSEGAGELTTVTPQIYYSQTGTIAIPQTQSIYSPITSVISTAFVANIITNQTNLNLRDWAVSNGWDQLQPVTITIASGVYIYSTNISPALTIDGIWPNSVTLINNGVIMGRGGGCGGWNQYVGFYSSTDGGHAISLGYNCIITNNGYILGGGGAGGTGRAYVSSTWGYIYPGGGGGAGGGGGGDSYISGGSFGTSRIRSGNQGGDPGNSGTGPVNPGDGSGGAAGGGGGGFYGGTGGQQNPGAGGGGGRRYDLLLGGSGGFQTNYTGSGPSIKLGGDGGSNGDVGSPADAVYQNGGGGGGGYGASGGAGSPGGTSPTVGGNAIKRNGYTATSTNNGTIYGAIS